MNRARRDLFARLSACLGVFGLMNPKEAWSQATDDRWLERAREKMRRAAEQEARNVDLLYSTKPKRVVLKDREYRIPANFFSPKQRDEPDTIDVRDGGFGFFLFLPSYEGYTKENWRNPFDDRRITVTQVTTVDKNAMVPMTDGTRHRTRPEGYGEPRAGFNNRKRSLEESPAYKLYGLEGYRPKNAGPDSEVTWVGTRSNGEFFFFDSTLAPSASPRPGRYAFCKVRYYSEKEDLLIAYHYSQSHIAKWREIDDAIWEKLHSWQLKPSLAGKHGRATSEAQTKTFAGDVRNWPRGKSSSGVCTL